MAWISPVIGGVITEPSELSKGLIEGKIHSPLIASIEINDDCMLKCPYCYLDRREKTNGVLSQSDLEQTIAEIVDSGVNIITIAGKEIFFDDKGINIIKFIDSRKKGNLHLKYGFITNGYRLDEYLEELKKLNFDWIDLSLDSYNGRGKSYTKIKEKIQELVNDKTLLDKLTISSVFAKDNANDLLELSQHLDQEDVRCHTITPNFDENLNSNTPFNDYIQLLESYISRGNFKNLEVYFIVGGMRDQKWFKGNYNLKQKFVDILDQDTYVLNGNIFVIFHNPLRYFRLTADGYVLSGKDIFKPNYHNFAVGNVKEESVKELIGKALKRDGSFEYYEPQLTLKVVPK